MNVREVLGNKTDQSIKRYLDIISNRIAKGNKTELGTFELTSLSFDVKFIF